MAPPESRSNKWRHTGLMALVNRRLVGHVFVIGARACVLWRRLGGGGVCVCAAQQCRCARAGPTNKRVQSILVRRAGGRAPAAGQL